MPTIKQKLAFKKIVENSGDIGKSMVEARYSPKTDTTNLTKSKGWKELLEQYLPDDKLLAAHDKALQATKWNDFTGDREDDHSIRLRAAELGYRLKGKLNEGSINISGDKVIAILGGVSVSSNDSDKKDIKA